MHDSISPPPRLRTRFLAPLLVLVLLLASVAVLQHWNVNEYAITPGQATPVAPLVSVKGVATTTHRDRFLLVDVWLQPLTAWQYLVMHLQDHVEFVSGAELESPGVPASQLTAQGFLEMYDSKEAAEVAAFRALGWKVPATGDGAVVTAVLSGTPASRAHVAVADDLVSFNGHPLANSCSLVRDLYRLAPGSAVRVGVRRAHISPSGAITWGAPSTLIVRTQRAPSSLGAMDCPGAPGLATSWLGVAVEDGVRYQLPARVTINTANIGGPSAGLAMTLTLMDKLNRYPLANGQKVAVTGTIDPYGDVGDVGGVAEKTIAAANAGAHYFIVPEVEVPTAQANAPSNLKIIGVTTLRQALSDLAAIGGSSRLRPLTTP